VVAWRRPAEGRHPRPADRRREDFTAVRFLVERVLAAGYKVLWLAHTHHLLDQAADAFGAPGASSVLPEAALVPEPRTRLTVRVVSGTIGHHRSRPSARTTTWWSDAADPCRRPATRAPRVCTAFWTLRVAALRNIRRGAPRAGPYLQPADRRSPRRNPGLVLLGLTATPAYADQSRRGWLPKLFPQGIIHQARRGALIAAGVLARPVFEKVATHYAPGFSAREYAKWVASFGRHPRAGDRRTRRAAGAQRLHRRHLRAGPSKYGRTIVFADRWYQCDYLCSALRKRGVRADAVYTHIDANPGTVEGRARRTADENERVLSASAGAIWTCW
jgi:hypothetical protein